MKRFGWLALFAVSAGLLGGCPIYPSERSHRVCTSSGCYDCPDNSYSDGCDDWQCSTASDCPSGFACNGQNQCVSYGPTPPGTCKNASECGAGQNCGADGACHPGDCSNSGCPGGKVCTLSGGKLSCVDPTVPGDGGAGCKNDAACSALGGGAKCLSGTCVKAEDQCSDATQCTNSQVCVQGVCTPSCSAQKPCPTGFSCDPRGVCSGNPNPCGTSAQCSGGTVCIQERCVSPCGSGGTCSNGLVCVDGGCIPDQKPQFVCGTDGKRGDGTPGNCAGGSTCLHHNCYISCDADASDSCRAADKFNVCKQVTTSSGTHSVCGSSSNLGTECDPTLGKNCATSQVCIDGFCR